MTDYKNTLNLPHTDFPMKAGLAQKEPEILKKWQAMNIYAKLRTQNAGKDKFILHDGPPYANGHLHLGHALNKTLKDIIVKAKTFSGFDAPYVPGWDCHGLPIELNVEKKHGPVGKKLSRKEFLDACRKYALEQINIQREEFKRLGVIGDWDHPYLTMDFKYEANIIRALGTIIENGHLLQGFKPVYWCVDCGSALAEAEVEYANKTSPAIDVRFKLVDEKDFLEKFSLGEGKGYSTSIPIWTTTPWTLPANEAVALNPNFDYVLIQTPTERLVIAQTLLENCLTRYGIEKYQTLKQFKGDKLEGILLQHPFYHREVPVILGDHVTMDAGTGAVHTAPAHGQEDYMVGLKYKLPIVNPVGSNGCFLPDTPLFAGEHVFKANQHIIEVLKENNNLLSDKKLEHSYPHCWRHKTPLIYRATPQWFISMEQQGLRVDALKAIKTVQWIPEWGQARIDGMIADRPDWCVSRQRVWGTPIPLFVHKHTQELHPDTAKLLERVADLVAEKGVEAWHELKHADLGVDAEQYDKLSDTLDVWFDSGVSHYCVLQHHQDLHKPADLYLEGSDQHRGWFHSALLTSVAIDRTAPYKQVLTHGYTVDDKGRKMSKSLGNVIAPEKVINSMGADILRLWAASVDYRAEITVSDEIFKRNSEAYRRIRNTTRFLLANLHDFDPEQHLVKPEEMLSLDRWAIDRARILQKEITEKDTGAYDNYQFHIVTQKIHQFCITDLGGFYLDIIKDRQYTMQKDSKGRRSAQTAIYHVLQALVRWMAPILSFTAEEIWQYIPGKKTESVFLTTWYDQLVKLDDEKRDAKFWEDIRLFRSTVNDYLEKARQKGEIGSSLNAEVTLYCAPKDKEIFQRLGEELRFVFITSNVHISPEPPKNPKGNPEIEVKASEHPKCARCWHQRADVGKDPAHPEICIRCVDNLPNGKGEERQFA